MILDVFIHLFLKKIVNHVHWSRGVSVFHALLLSLYLCRAARGSADIPILPHAHTILLKHAVNLKEERGSLC